MESFIQVVALYSWDLTKTILIYQEPLLTPKCQEIKIVWRGNVIRKPFKTIRKRTLVRNIYFISVLGHLKWKFVDTCCSLAPFSIYSQRKTLSCLVSGLDLFWNIVLELWGALNSSLAKTYNFTEKGLPYRRFPVSFTEYFCCLQVLK